MADQDIQVVLVEDNAEHAQMLARLLVESNNPVFEVTSYPALRPALDALESARNRRCSPGPFTAR